MQLPIQEFVSRYASKSIKSDSPPLYFKMPIMSPNQSEDKWIWKDVLKTLNTHPKPKFAAIFNNTYLYGQNGNIENNGDSLDEYPSLNSYNSPNLSASIRPHNQICIVNLIDSFTGSNYYHWIQTGLAKLLALPLLNYMDTKKYTYLVNSLQPNYVKESLKALNIPLENCIELKDKKVYIVNNLITTSSIKDGDIEAINYLRKSLRIRNDTKGSKKLYISRAKANQRRISNEDQVWQVLQPMGFTKLQCEDLPFKKQVDIFKKASVIVSPHGAGLTNTIFAPLSTKVLEIRNRNYLGLCYYKICNNMGIQYYNLFGNGNDVSTIKDLSTNLDGDIIVDIQELKAMLEKMEIL